jgi:DNA-binding NarL/FixJ family response regulator
MDALSPRERDVLRILVTGSTNADICSELSFSETTVKTHVSGIFGVRNRADAALDAFRAGMVT